MTDRRPQASDDDVVAVERLLGRRPQGAFRVVVRDHAGAPVVIENEPLLEDGTPMPTRYWLVGREAVLAVSRLESSGAIGRARAEIPPDAVIESHERYAAARARALPVGWTGPLPSGGVGGTRVSIKCLHAHLAWHLAGGGDPVGAWVIDRLAEAGVDRFGHRLAVETNDKMDEGTL